MQERDALFLGLDASTQSLKALVIDSSLKVVYEKVVNFDSDLPEFKTDGGAHHHADGLTVTAPPLMWIAALDLLLERIAADEFPFGKVTAISGSGQQHGSVYLGRGARTALMNLTDGIPLRSQLGDIFPIADSPIWMDSSTARQCRERESAMGGPQAVADLTGSRAYKRFTGNQIAKIFQTQPDAYEATERIALVSSFLASLLIGGYAPIDAADGAGMNLMDIRSKTWNAAALQVTAPQLETKLGSIAPSHCGVGRLHKYYCEAYNFSPECVVIAFSGDNPNSLAGLMLQRAGDVAISLGTSDTVFGSLAEPTPSASEGHIFANPVDTDGYMAMICYKNGSLTREYVRDTFTGGTWKEFEGVLGGTPVGNNGRLGFYIREPEITPTIMQTGIFRFDADNRPVAGFPPGAEARAVVEGQCLSMRLHAANIGLRPTSILATGGASSNASIIRIMSDVFGVPVFRGEQPSSAALGAAYRALHGLVCEQRNTFVPFAEILAGAPSFKIATEPDMNAHAVYSAMMERYTQLENKLG